MVPILHYWFLLNLIATTLLLGLARNTTGLLVPGCCGLILSWFDLDLDQIAYFLPFAVTGALLRERMYLPPVRGWLAACVVWR